MKRNGEFGGTPGNLLMMIGLPAVIYVLYFSVRFNGGDLMPSPVIDYRPFGNFRESLLPTWRAALVCLSWLGFQAILHLLLPGRRVKGAALEDGSRLTYRLNGLLSFAVTLAALGVLAAAGVARPGAVYDHFGAIISVMIMVSFAFSLFLYLYGRAIEPGRTGGNAVRDFFMGVALNPRIPPVTGFDLKFFCESRPGLIGWLAITLSFAWAQYERHGAVTLPMALVAAFQFLYVADYFWHEEAILTTTDIVNDRFGFMLAFGDLAWVPLTYSLQAFYLVGHPHDLPAWGAAGIILLNLAGYLLFRGANLQKHRFRTDPDFLIRGKRPDYIQTRQGNRLLVSGFWGLSRHFNYVGDIMMALAWCLPCLFDSIIPYFYVIYFTALLVHRERRDDRKCAAKYGEDWERYRERVPWRIVPGMY